MKLDPLPIRIDPDATLTSGRFAGMPIIEDPRCPRDTIMVGVDVGGVRQGDDGSTALLDLRVGGTLIAHPMFVVGLRAGTMKPLWSQWTVGTAEARRDRRRHGRTA